MRNRGIAFAYFLDLCAVAAAFFLLVVLIKLIPQLCVWIWSHWQFPRPIL